MNKEILNTARDLTNIIKLNKDGYQLLSISYLGGRKVTLQYSLINYHKPALEHFFIDTFGKTLPSIGEIYYNAKIFELEINRIHDNLIENSTMANNWNISPNLQSLNFTFKFEVSNDRVEHATINQGFSYHIIEKNLMMRDVKDIPNVLAQLCGLCSTGHTLAFCLLIEKITGISDEIGEDISRIRILLAEIERIGNHLLWIGISTFSTGLKSVGVKALDLRTKIEQVLTKLKLGPSLNVVGGIYVNSDKLSTLTKSIDKLYNDILLLEEDKEFNQFKIYTSDVAILSAKSAQDFGSLGPISRASGNPFDTRVDFPYSGYKSTKYTPVNRPEGDLTALFIVKWNEILASIELVIELLGTISYTGVKPVKTPKIVNSEIAHSYVEAPNGLLQYTGKINEGKFDQLRIAVPTMNNLLPTIRRLIGPPLQFITLILRGIDMGYDPNDKLIFSNRQERKIREITGFNLQEKARKVLQNGNNLNFSDL